MMDASILLPPTGTPLTGIDFVKRLPCGDVEKTRRVSKNTDTDQEIDLLIDVTMFAGLSSHVREDLIRLISSASCFCGWLCMMMERLKYLKWHGLIKTLFRHYKGTGLVSFLTFRASEKQKAVKACI